MIRVDLHAHTAASSDCRVAPSALAAESMRLGLSPIFVTDHNTIRGARELRAAGVRVVTGEEILTTEGELIGLFLTKQIPRGFRPAEAVAEIKRQGGLVYVQHPYDINRRHLSEDAIESLARDIDIVEVYNGRSDAKSNRLAADLRATIGAAPGAGSDAHTLAELGSVFVEMEDFDDAQDFLAKLRKGKIVVGRSQLRLLVEARFRRPTRPAR